MKDKLIIVNREGYWTGKTADRREVHSQGLPHGVVYVVPVTSDMQVLETRRGKNSHYLANVWFPATGGHVEERDLCLDYKRGMYANAAVRELKEEMGLKIGKERLIDLGIGRLIDLTPISNGNNLEYINVYSLKLDEDTQTIVDSVKKKARKRNAELTDARLRPVGTVVEEILTAGLFDFLGEDFKKDIIRGVLDEISARVS